MTITEAVKQLSLKDLIAYLQDLAFSDDECKERDWGCLSGDELCELIDATPFTRASYAYDPVFLNSVHPVRGWRYKNFHFCDVTRVEAWLLKETKAASL